MHSSQPAITAAPPKTQRETLGVPMSIKTQVRRAKFPLVERTELNPGCSVTHNVSIVELVVMEATQNILCIAYAISTLVSALTNVAAFSLAYWQVWMKIRLLHYLYLLTAVLPFDVVQRGRQTNHITLNRT